MESGVEYITQDNCDVKPWLSLKSVSLWSLSWHHYGVLFWDMYVCGKYGGTGDKGQSLAGIFRKAWN